MKEIRHTVHEDQARLPQLYRLLENDRDGSQN